MRAPEFHYFTADDWGLTPSTNEGILALAQSKILRRVTLMANTKYLTHLLEELKVVPHLEFGPHLNFTYGRPLSAEAKAYFGEQFWSLQRFLVHMIKLRFFARWHFAKLSRILEIEAEAQMNKIETLGVPLRFLNTHHHAHLIPGVLEAIVPCLQKRNISDVRNLVDHRHWLKSTALVNLFSIYLKPYFKRMGLISRPTYYPLPHDFESQEDFEGYMQTSPTEVILHPAVREDTEALEFPDDLGYQRSIEHAKLLLFYGNK